MTRLVFNADTLGGTTTLSSTDSESSFNLVIPAANGTLATTTNLAAYLALTGGTLTGALTGTTFSGAFNGSIGTTTPSTGAFTTLSASSTVSGAGFSNYLASPPAIGGTSASSGAFTTLSASGQFTLTNASGYNIYASGTAANVFAGTTSLGGIVGSESLRVTPVASAVNYVEVLGASTGVSPVLQSTGSDTNVNAVFATKGTGAHLFRTNGNTANTQFQVAHTASAVNYLQVNGATTGNAATMSAQGSDTNIDIAFTPKGTGYVKFGTLTASSDVAITGYITIKDAAGTTRKLAVIA